MSLRIGFDLDGVLADMDSELLRQAEAIFGEAATRQAQRRAQQRGAQGAAPAPADTDVDADAATADVETDSPPISKLNLTPRQHRRLWHHVIAIENFWGSLHEIEPGSIARLAQLASERRWEIIFLTKRPGTAGATAQVQSQRWLESKGFALPSVYVVQGSRGLIAAALSLDVVVDDRPENCLDVVVDSEAKAMLVWRDSAKLLPAAAQRLGIEIVPSVAQCLDMLSSIGEAPSQGPSMLSRVKRLFGRKDGADA